MVLCELGTVGCCVCVHICFYYVTTSLVHSVENVISLPLFQSTTFVQNIMMHILDMAF